MHLSREQRAQESAPERRRQLEGGRGSGGNRETRRGWKGNPEVHAYIQYQINRKEVKAM